MVQDTTKVRPILLITNRKSNTRFRLVPKSTTLVDPEMTLDGNFARCCITQMFFSEPTTKIWMKIDPYYQPQKCSPGILVSGEISFMQIFAGVRWRGGVKWECGRWKWRFSLLSFTVFRTFYIYGHTIAFRWYDCQWPWAYFKVIGLFYIKFLKNGPSYGKSYYRLLIGNHTLAVDWCHLWWHWMIFEGQFTLPNPISRKLYMIRSRKVKLLIRNQTSAFRWYV